MPYDAHSSPPSLIGRGVFTLSPNAPIPPSLSASAHVVERMPHRKMGLCLFPGCTVRRIEMRGATCYTESGVRSTRSWTERTSLRSQARGHRPSSQGGQHVARHLARRHLLCYTSGAPHCRDADPRRVDCPARRATRGVWVVTRPSSGEAEPWNPEPSKP